MSEAVMCFRGALRRPLERLSFPSAHYFLEESFWPLSADFTLDQLFLEPGDKLLLAGEPVFRGLPAAIAAKLIQTSKSKL